MVDQEKSERLTKIIQQIKKESMANEDNKKSELVASLITTITTIVLVYLSAHYTQKIILTKMQIEPFTHGESAIMLFFFIYFIDFLKKSK